MFPERNFDDRKAAEFALREVAAPDGLLLSRFAPDSSYVGKTVADIARLRKTDPVDDADAAHRRGGSHEGEGCGGCRRRHRHQHG